MERELVYNLLKQKGIGNKTILELLGRYSDISEWGLLKDIPEKLSAGITRALRYEHQSKSECVGIWEDTYPKLLKEIQDPPVLLFYKGSLEGLFKPCISIVGTRRMTSYGKEVTELLATKLSRRGFTIVSGMATGVDSAAHRAALKLGNPTVAVLGAGVTEPTPKSNEKLYNEIIESGGCIVSEFDDVEIITPGLFARRNRLIAGLSKATIVTEAGGKSGALITADLALDFNREVFAVPGNIERSKSFGTNNLIKSGGGQLILSYVDILEGLNYDVSEQGSAGMNNKGFEMLRDERIIYESLLVEAKSAEKLATEFSMSIQLILSHLSLLELKGLVVSDERGVFRVRM